MELVFLLSVFCSAICNQFSLWSFGECRIVILNFHPHRYHQLHVLLILSSVLIGKLVIFVRTCAFKAFLMLPVLWFCFFFFVFFLRYMVVSVGNNLNNDAGYKKKQKGRKQKQNPLPPTP